MCPPVVAGTKLTEEVPSPVNKVSSGPEPPGKLPLVIDGLLAVSVVPSTVIVHSSLLFMIAPVNRLAELYGSHYSVSGLGTFATLIILACSSMLGLFGAWMAMTQHLRRQHAMQDK